MNRRPTRTRYLVLAMLCAAAMIAYISRNSISVPADQIQQELDLTATEMGWVISAFFWTYAIAQVPAGWLGQRWGTRRALSLYAVIWSAASVMSGLATGFLSLVAARMAFGFAQAGIFPCSANTVAAWLPAGRRGIATGSLAAFMSIGGAISLALTGLLLEGADFASWRMAPLEWRMIFGLLALPGVIWAIVFFVWFRDRPEEHSAVNEAELFVIRETAAPVEAESTATSATADATPTPWGAILASPAMWFICAQQFFRAAGYIFLVTWYPTWLQKVHHVTMSKSGLLGSVPLFAAVAGSLIGGGVVDFVWRQTGSKRWSRQGVAVTGLGLCATLVLLAGKADSLQLAVTLLATGTFCATLCASCGYTVTIDKGGAHIGPVFGLMNMSGNFGAALLPVVVGWMFDREYYSQTLLLVAAIYVAGAICWLLLDPEGTLFDNRDRPPWLDGAVSD